MTVDRGHAAMSFSFASGSASRRSASGSCRSTNDPDGVVARCIRRSKHQGRSAARRSCGRSFTERHPVKLIQDGAMEALANSIGLRAFGFGSAVINVFEGEIELVFMALGTAKLGATIGQHARQPDTVFIVEGHHPVIEDLGRGN